MNCHFSDQSEADLDEIGSFIARDNPARAITFVKELRDHCEKITNAPERVIVDWVEDMPIRKVVHGSYNVFYIWLEKEKVVYIARIMHSARQGPQFSV